MKHTAQHRAVFWYILSSNGRKSTLEIVLCADIHDAARLSGYMCSFSTLPQSVFNGDKHSPFDTWNTPQTGWRKRAVKMDPKCINIYIYSMFIANSYM